MDIHTAINIVEKMPPAASLWPVKNSNYDLPEAVLTLSDEFEDLEDLKTENKNMESEINEMVKEIEDMKKYYNAEFNRLLDTTKNEKLTAKLKKLAENIENDLENLIK